MRANRLKVFLSASLSVALLGGCANEATTCPLNNKEGYCASVPEVADAARAHAGGTENVMGNGAYKKYVKGHGHKGDDAQQDSVPSPLGYSGQAGGPSARNGQPGSPLVENGVRDPGPGVGLAGPIYTPATPRRLWVAPYSDKSGVVHSGEFVYFLTKGKWKFGGLKTPGSASGLMGPVAPSDLGFNPNMVTDQDQGGDRQQDADDPSDIERPAMSITPPMGGSSDITTESSDSDSSDSSDYGEAGYGPTSDDSSDSSDSADDSSNAQQ